MMGTIVCPCLLRPACEVSFDGLWGPAIVQGLLLRLMVISAVVNRSMNDETTCLPCLSFVISVIDGTDLSSFRERQH